MTFLSVCMLDLICDGLELRVYRSYYRADQAAEQSEMNSYCTDSVNKVRDSPVSGFAK